MSIFSPKALLKIKPKFTNYPKPYLNENNLVNSYAFQLAFQTSYGGEGHKSSIYLFTQVQIQQNNNYYNVRQEDLSCFISFVYSFNSSSCQRIVTKQLFHSNISFKAGIYY